MDKPERVERLVLLGVPGNVLNCHPPFALRLASLPMVNRLLFSLVSPKNTGNSLRGLLFMGHSEEMISHLPFEMAECYYYFQKLPHYKISSLSLMEETNTLFGAKANIQIKEAELRGIKQPTLLIWGMKDPFGGVETWKKINAAIPGSMFVTLSNGGHLPWLDDPTFCGMRINKFLYDTMS
jgi:pimeloyl-ACP methyl ester carboxylesterase